MNILDVSIPGWVGQAVMILGSMGVGGFVLELWKRRNPTVKEKADTEATTSEVFSKKFEQGLLIYEQLNTQVKKIVEVETKKFSDIMFRKEMAHMDEIKGWQDKLHEANDKILRQNEKIEALELRIDELEQNNFKKAIT